jgi:monofunctional biosynthetic peptidoglycan transglycosylase
MAVLLMLGALLVQTQTNWLTLFDFSETEQIDVWTIVNDGVMGGVSDGQWYLEDEYAVFEGVISLDNNGGFSSVRIAFRPVDMAAFDGVVLRVRGDGQTYAFGLRDANSRLDYRYSFETAVTEDDAWQTVFIPFEDLTATYFGREYLDAPAFDSAVVRGMNLIISDEQEGAFRLEVAGIALYRVDEDDRAI